MALLQQKSPRIQTGEDVKKKNENPALEAGHVIPIQKILLMTYGYGASTPNFGMPLFTDVVFMNFSQAFSKNSICRSGLINLD